MPNHARNDNNYALCYYRFSSASQNEASIDMQRDECLAMAQRRGLQVLQEFIDEAKSAWKDGGIHRPGFHAMLQAVKELKPAHVIMYSSDRFARNFYSGIADDGLILEAGAMPIYTDNSIPETEGMVRQLALAFHFSSNEKSSTDSSKKIREALALRGRRGHYAGVPILGYRGEPDKPYTIDEKTAPLVQRMFSEYAAGKSMAAICREVNAEGWRTVNDKTFTVTGMAKILKNRAYIGEYQFAGSFIEDGMPRLVPDDVFDKVQARLETNKRTGAQKARIEAGDDAPRFWLTGKLFCGHCGETMRGTSGTGRHGDKHYYYECKGHRKRSGCKKKNVRKEEVEGMVLRVLKRALNDTELLANLAGDMAAYRQEHSEGMEAGLVALEAELSDVSRKVENLVDAIADTDPEKRPRSLLKRLEALEERQAQIEQAVELEARRLEIAQDADSFAAMYREYANANLDDPLVRDQVFEYFIDKIYLFDDRLVITGWFAEKSGMFEFGDVFGNYQVDYGGEGFDPLTLCSTKFSGTALSAVPMHLMA